MGNFLEKMNTRNDKERCRLIIMFKDYIDTLSNLERFGYL